MSRIVNNRKAFLAGLVVNIAIAMVSMLLTSGCGEEESSTVTSIGGEVTAVPPRKSDVIVFIRGGEVWAINPDNGIERRVTSDGSPKSWPRLSPDGARILYQVSPGGDGRFSDIWQAGLAEGSTTEYIREGGAYPAWSTDGKSIAWCIESPRLSWRLHLLRGWSHEHTKAVSQRA
jgi:hypothetical protein